MLTLTDTAVKAISALTTQPGMPEDTGVRIALNNMKNGAAPAFEMSIAHGPDQGDQVLETGSARVYMPTVAAQELADQTLDAQVTEQGHVEFLIGPVPGPAAGDQPQG